MVLLGKIEKDILQVLRECFFKERVYDGNLGKWWVGGDCWHLRLDLTLIVSQPAVLCL